jgi:hypothetical protein
MTEENTDWASLLSDFECEECGETLEDCLCDDEEAFDDLEEEI